MDVDKLKLIFKQKESDLQEYLIKELANMAYSVAVGRDVQNNTIYLYATIADALPVLLIAHTDIAHDHPPKEIYYDDIDGLLISPTGLGADDRAGVFAIMELIKNHRCDVLFTAGEEKGSTGAKNFVKDYAKNDKYHMLVQLDKDGEREAVFYVNDAKDFQDYIISFDFEPTISKATDIKFIAPKWRVNAVNLSVGYYCAHKRYENLNLRHLQNAIDRIDKLLSQAIPKYKYRESDDVVE